MHSIEIRYHDKKIEKLCTDIRKAKKDLPAIVAEKLHALVNLLESAENLQDIADMPFYHLHSLHGDREGSMHWMWQEEGLDIDYLLFH